MRKIQTKKLDDDEDQQAKAKRDPVAPAKRSEAAMRKIQTKKLDDGTMAIQLPAS